MRDHNSTPACQMMAAPELQAREIVAYSDAELDRYLEQNGRIVSVQDPQNLPESFIQRLRDRVHSASRSRPVDLDQVSARLLQAFPKEHNPPETRPWYTKEKQGLWGLSEEAARLLGFIDRTGPETPSDSSSGYKTPNPEEKRCRGVLEERVYYGELTRKGGRPWYPIHLIEPISKNPSEYRDMLRAWQEYPDAEEVDWEVFAKQQLRWYRFGEWQGKRRKEYDGRISDYTRWAKKLLDKYSFSRPFEFEEDPEEQDRLTTWIEYLAYEYNIYRVRYSWYERRAKWYNDQWQKVADSGLLRPYETYETVVGGKLSFELSLQHTSEEERARKAVRAAEAAVSMAQRAIRESQRPSASASRRLAAAQSKLDTAKRSLELIDKRNGLIDEFFVKTRDYREAKRLRQRQLMLLQWIQGQIPLIEAELGKSGVSEGTRVVPSDQLARISPGKETGSPNSLEKTPPGLPPGSNQPTRQARKRGHDSMTQGERPPPKRMRRDAIASPNVSSALGSLTGTATKPQYAMRAQTVGMQSTSDAPEPTAAVQQPLRRSARIAARQARPETTTAPRSSPRRVKEQRQKPGRNRTGASQDCARQG